MRLHPPGVATIMGPMESPREPRRHLPPASMWTTWPALRILALAVMLMAGNFLLQIIFYGMGGGLFLPVLVGSVGGVVVPLRLLASRTGLPLRDDFGLHVPAIPVVLAAALMAVAALSPTSLLAQFSVRLHPPDAEWLNFMADNMPQGPVELALAFLAVVVAAPLAEELVFRGLVHRLASHLWGPWPAAVVSALVFGVVHGEPWYLFGLVGIGFVLAVVYEATGSLVACWITHAVHNAISLSMMIWGDDGGAEVPALSLVDGLIAGGSLVLLVLLSAYLWQNRPDRHA